MARRQDEEEYEYEYEEEEYEEEEGDGDSWLDKLSNASWRRALVVPLILLLFGFGAWTLWKKYRDEVLAHPSYGLDQSDISYTAAPEWIKHDILAEVIKIGSLESKRIHDAGLTVQVASAFELHPWVKRVNHVRIHYPAKLDVELTYRKPVAMVVMPDDEPTDGQAYIQPIDADAVWLPPEDFTPEFAQSFPRIDVGNTMTPDSPGLVWSDEFVADAAKIAELLLADWDTFKTVLYQIERSSQPASISNAGDFDIRGRPDLGPTPPGLLIHWGRAPGKEQVGEPTAKAKLKFLKTWVDARLRDRLPAGEVDLRTARTLQAAKPGRILR